MGFEGSFRIGVPPEYVVFCLTIRDGSETHSAGVRYVYASGKWQYYNSLGGWSDLLTLDNALGSGAIFHPVKMVVDFTTDFYTRLVLSNREVDMSTLACEVYDEATTPRLEASTTVYSTVGVNSWCYIDDLILTQNEPV